MAESQIKREIAQKVRVVNIHMGNYVKQEGWLPNYVQTQDGRKISRVNIIGTVVDSSIDNEFGQDTIIIDDGSANIEVRDFEGMHLKKITKGNIVIIIGKIKEYNGTKYILPEIVKDIENPKWIVLRNAELELYEKQNKFDQKYLEKFEQMQNEDNNYDLTNKDIINNTENKNKYMDDTTFLDSDAIPIIEEDDLSCPQSFDDYKPKFKNDFICEFDKIKDEEISESEKKEEENKKEKIVEKEEKNKKEKIVEKEEEDKKEETESNKEEIEIEQEENGYLKIINFIKRNDSGNGVAY
ncbi:MAG: hypothetical protein PHX85_04550, partial [Methanobacteriaceae archaeon]|nr:hypothetical protein [Methanobacteriaceae archaeon]